MGDTTIFARAALITYTHTHRIAYTRECKEEIVEVILALVYITLLL